MNMVNALAPSAGLLCKIGSIITHVEEGAGENGHQFDWITVRQLMADPEVQAWLAHMGKMAMLPVKRDPGGVKTKAISKQLKRSRK